MRRAVVLLAGVPGAGWSTLGFVRGLGNSIAYLFTPWAWRRRLAVEAVAAVGIILLGVALYGSIDHRVDTAGNLVSAGISGSVVFLLITRPAVRSLLRWHALHGDG